MNIKNPEGIFPIRGERKKRMQYWTDVSIQRISNLAAAILNKTTLVQKQLSHLDKAPTGFSISGRAGTSDSCHFEQACANKTATRILSHLELTSISISAPSDLITSKGCFCSISSCSFPPPSKMNFMGRYCKKRRLDKFSQGKIAIVKKCMAYLFYKKNPSKR